MNMSDVVNDAEKHFSDSIVHFESEIKKLRTGRAHPSMLDGVMIEAYGTQIPLNQAATVTVADAQLLLVTPFDPNNLQSIANSIRNNQSLGLNPTDDGRVIRVPIPSLTEDRRRDLSKVVGQKHEECMVSLRNIRHDTLSQLDKAKKDKFLSEDEEKRFEKHLEELMLTSRTKIEQLAKAKIQEIMTV